jgi:inosine/xanthosine triphosphatase
VKTIVIASTNPVKMEAARQGFEKMFPGESFELRSIEAPSAVRDQPMSSLETQQGAHNRARAAAKAIPQADYWVGIEGGIEDLGEEMAAFAWVVVYSPHLTGKGRTGTFFLPPAVATLIRQGKELGEADDIVFNQNNSKQTNGAIGILTGDVIDRTRLYEHAVILALAPFKNPDLYVQ